MSGQPVPRRLVVAITGASGACYGIKLLEICAKLPDVETHLIVSRGARATIRSETGRTVAEVTDLADVLHAENELGASIASGSFPTFGMIVAPCSIKTLSGIASSYAENLTLRAADVTLQEGRPLLLMVRETPTHAGHLQLMLRATECGAVIYPPVPAFYANPVTVDDIVEHSCRRALARIGIVTAETYEWGGLSSRPGGERD